MTQQQIDAVVQSLRQQFGEEVEAEAVNNQGRYRLAVISPQFEGMPHHERQQAMWSVVDTVLDRPTSMDISLILAFAPSDLRRNAS